MSVLYRCDVKGCEAQAEGWSGPQHAPPPRWYTLEIIAGDRGPGRVVEHTVHACSPEHVARALIERGF